MPEFQEINYNAVLDDLEAKKTKIEDAIAAIKKLLELERPYLSPRCQQNLDEVS
jgi:hypothetical protein